MIEDVGRRRGDSAPRAVENGGLPFGRCPASAKLARVGGFSDPSVEKVLALHPDLLLVQPAPGNQKPVEKLAELGVRVLALPMHPYLDGQTQTKIAAAVREFVKAGG